MSNPERLSSDRYGIENGAESSMKHTIYRARGEKANAASAREMMRKEAELEHGISEREKYLASLLAEMEKRFPEQEQPKQQEQRRQQEQPRQFERPPVKPQTKPQTETKPSATARGKHEIVKSHEEDDIDDYIESIHSSVNKTYKSAAKQQQIEHERAQARTEDHKRATNESRKQAMRGAWDFEELSKYKMSPSDSAPNRTNMPHSNSANSNSTRRMPETSKPEPTKPETIRDIKDTYDKSKHNSIFHTKTQKIIAGSLVLTSVAALVAAGALYVQDRFKKDNTEALARPATEAAERGNVQIGEDASLVNGAEDIYLSNGDTATWAAPEARPIFTDGYQNQPPFIGAQPSQTQLGQAQPAQEYQPRTNGMSQQEILDMMAKSPEFRQGLIDGYNKPGMWLSETKPSDISFASAKDLSEMFNNDEVDMMQYAAANQVETFADYLACMPDAIKPESIKGLTLEQVIEMLETTDDESYRGLQTWFNNVMDMAYTRRTVLDGRYHNAYMMLRDGNGPLDHENMQLVSCISDEYGAEVTEFYWLDNEGHEVGSMLVKMIPVRNTEGDIIGYDGCMQAVTPAGGHLYDGLPTVDPPEPENPPYVPPYIPPDTPPENPPVYVIVDPKNPANLVRIDEQAHDDIAEDIGTGAVVVTPTESVSQEDLTEQPDVTDYSPVYTEGEDQAQADAGEIPIEQAPTEGVDLEDIMAEFGNNEVNRIISEVRSNPVEFATTDGINIEDILAEYGIQ